ncbi:BrnT family toxin [Candidatus Woesearchaeota archaeon]|nr:BrnT family toxin [Candidatus Woesearchaeota archaeon]
MEFMWHDEKSKTNLTKHGVSFDEAKSVFFDEFARLEHDPDHSKHEDRFVLLGISSLLKLLVLCQRQTDAYNLFFSAPAALCLTLRNDNYATQDMPCRHKK